MEWADPEDGGTFLPLDPNPCPVVVVRAGDSSVLSLLFGERAEEAAEILRKYEAPEGQS